MPPDTQALCLFHSQGIFESEFLCLDAMKDVHSYPEVGRQVSWLHCLWSGYWWPFHLGELYDGGLDLTSGSEMEWNVALVLSYFRV